MAPPPGPVGSGSGSQKPAQGHGRTLSDTLADAPVIDLIRETVSNLWTFICPC